MEGLVLYHGSSAIVKTPMFGKGKSYNDYGRGFYCTEHLELAKEWACNEDSDGYVNEYEMDMEGLNVLDLSSKEHTVLHWLALLMEYRRFRIATPAMKRGADWLRDRFLIDLAPYDVVIGYRADDSYFSFAKAFVNNQISLEQLAYAMHLGDLGDQFVLKSPAAFERIRFVSCDVVDGSVYYPKRKIRDEKARAAFQAELEKDFEEGLYIRELVIGEVNADDPRLR